MLLLFLVFLAPRFLSFFLASSPPPSLSSSLSLHKTHHLSIQTIHLLLSRPPMPSSGQSTTSEQSEVKGTSAVTTHPRRYLILVADIPIQKLRCLCALPLIPSSPLSPSLCTSRDVFSCRSPFPFPSTSPSPSRPGACFGADRSKR